MISLFSQEKVSEVWKYNLLRQGREEGIRAAVAILRDFPVEPEAAVQKITRQFGLTPEEAEKRSKNTGRSEAKAVKGVLFLCGTKKKNQKEKLFAQSYRFAYVMGYSLVELAQGRSPKTSIYAKGRSANLCRIKSTSRARGKIT